jgi:TPP-dependent pyruvate/acetoin dehydrogenase alpha subunit
MTEEETCVANCLGLAELERMYGELYTIRRFELRAVEQYRLGNIRGYFHPYLGEEAIAVGVIGALRPDDYIVSTHRGHGHAIAKGHEIGRMYAELFGKATGYCRGRGGSMHVSSAALFNLGANGIVGGGIPIAVGAALGLRQKQSDQVVVCFFSDGAAGNGVFHESLNLASVFELPVIFVLENNQYAVSTPVEYSAKIVDLYRRAEGYGMPGVMCDGNDAVAVYLAARTAVERARNAQGPTLLECKTFRHGGHHVNDPGAYMPKEVVERWQAHDPLDVMRAHLLRAGTCEATIQAIEAAVEQEIEAGIQFAMESPEPTREDFLAEGLQS